MLKNKKSKYIYAKLRLNIFFIKKILIIYTLNIIFVFYSLVFFSNILFIYNYLNMN